MKNSSALPPPETAAALHDGVSGVPELDLPEAPDFVSRRTPLSLEQALTILDERRRWFPLSAAAREARRRRQVTAEFIL